MLKTERLTYLLKPEIEGEAGPYMPHREEQPATHIMRISGDTAWGVMLENGEMIGDSEISNYGTLPFYQGQYEPREGMTREEKTLCAAKYLVENGCKVKGHPLCWHTVSAKWLLEKDDDAVLENQLARIRREVGAFREYIALWDVINEVVIMPVFDKEDSYRFCGSSMSSKTHIASFLYSYSMLNQQLTILHFLHKLHQAMTV